MCSMEISEEAHSIIFPAAPASRVEKLAIRKWIPHKAHLSRKKPGCKLFLQQQLHLGGLTCLADKLNGNGAWEDTSGVSKSKQESIQQAPR